MNAELAALLPAVAAEPEDEEARLVLADWLEEQGDGPRAELIRVQCALLAAHRNHERPRQLERRERELLRKFRKLWHGTPPARWRVEFERGLLIVGTNGTALTRRPGTTWWERHRAWVSGLCLDECNDSTLRRILPRLAGVPMLSFDTRARSGSLPTDSWLWKVASWGRRYLLPNPPPTLTDVGVSALAELKGLRLLGLSGTQLTDAGLKALASLTDLRSLRLDETAITDEGLQVLRRMKQLLALNLSYTAVTDAGLRQLSGLRRLEALRLTHCQQVTDEGVRSLAKLKGLRELDLGYTGVTDVGLRRLAGLTQLHTLLLGGAGKQYTAAGVRELRRALPGCEIDHYR